MPGTIKETKETNEGPWIPVGSNGRPMKNGTDKPKNTEPTREERNEAFFREQDAREKARIAAQSEQPSDRGRRAVRISGSNASVTIVEGSDYRDQPAPRPAPATAAVGPTSGIYASVAAGTAQPSKQKKFNLYEAFPGCHQPEASAVLTVDAASANPLFGKLFFGTGAAVGHQATSTKSGPAAARRAVTTAEAAVQTGETPASAKKPSRTATASAAAGEAAAKADDGWKIAGPRGKHTTRKTYTGANPEAKDEQPTRKSGPNFSKAGGTIMTSDKAPWQREFETTSIAKVKTEGPIVFRGGRGTIDTDPGSANRRAAAKAAEEAESEQARREAQLLRDASENDNGTTRWRSGIGRGFTDSSWAK